MTTFAQNITIMANVKGKNERPQDVHNQIEYRRLSELKPNPKNPRKSTKEAVEKLAESIKSNPTFFEARPILLSDRTGELVIIGGERRSEAAKLLGLTFVPTILLHGLDEAAEDEILIKDNTHAGVWDEQKLQAWGKEQLQGWNVEGVNWDNPKKQYEDTGVRGILEKLFITPPFTVLNTRGGEWQKRKKIWKSLIQEFGETRKGVIKNTNKNSFKYQINDGVSLFDPVLMEVILKWFNIDGGAVFDPMAGDTTKGYVVSKMGMQFTGIEIRPEQVNLNNKKMQNTNAKYICDDGQNVAKYFEPESQDLLFCCPPYYNLEHYSDLPNDASNQPSYVKFIEILQNTFTSAIKCLKEDRFAVIVVGDIRNKEGFYYGFPDDVKSIFRNEGVRLYNELVLVESIGTLSMQVSRYMKSRKIGKCHQNVLVFYKGNPKNIVKNFKEIKYTQSDLDAFAELN